jgi:murein DD-endopeptidase MepM/ murein hydrolase activator NlpD
MLRILLVFLAGLLLGANVVYFALRHAEPRATASAPPAAVPIVAPPASVPAPAQVTAAKPVPAAQPSATASIPASPMPDATAAIGPTGLLLPVAGVRPGQLVDTYADARSEGRVHDAIDIMAPRGTPVLAASDGSVAKLFASERGGLTVYEFDPTATWVYYYAHLDRYAEGLAEGRVLHRGDVVGYVGSTGNANPDAPHLHFEISRLGPEKHWWQATPVNPYPLLGGKSH